MKKKIYLRSISSNQLSELQKSSSKRKIVNDPISIYITEKRIKEKNRINFFNAEKKAIVHLDKDEVKEMLEVNLIAIAVALLPHDNSVLKDMKGEDAVNLIAKQAQNVQEDGSVSELQTPQAAYDTAVRNFGKELVDAAIEANPLFSFLRQFFFNPK